MINKRCILQAALFIFVVCVVFAGGLTVACREKPGCQKDTDCKGNRICEHNVCVSPESKASNKKETPSKTVEDKGKQGSASAKTKASIVGPGGRPSTSTSRGDLTVRICKNGKCRTLDRSLMGDPGAVLKLFDMLGGGMDFTGTRLEICSKKHCVELDETFGQDPDDVFKLFGMLGNLLPTAGTRLLFGKGPDSRAATKVKRDPPGKIAYRSSAALIKDGDGAVDKVAKLEDLEISAVWESQAVFKGQGNLLVVVDVPPKLTPMLSKLRTHASKVTVTFYVVRPPLSNIIHGELIRFK